MYIHCIYIFGHDPDVKYKKYASGSFQQYLYFLIVLLVSNSTNVFVTFLSEWTRTCGVAGFRGG